MAFKLTPNVHVKRDKDGNVRLLRHPQEPFKLPGLVAPSARALADQYLHGVTKIFGISSNMLTDLNKPVGKVLSKDPTQIRFKEQKSVMESTVISYQQSHFGIPILNAGIVVQVHGPDLRVTSSQNTIQYNVKVKNPDPKAKYMPPSCDATVVAHCLGYKKESPLPKIKRTGLLIYRYDPDQRIDPESKKKPQPFESPPPTLKLPGVPREIKAGEHYVVTEVYFTFSLPDLDEEVEWYALLEVNTGAVLYLRAFVDGASGAVCNTDPLSASGDVTITPCSPAATLDALADAVTLQRLIPGNPQALSGRFIEIQDSHTPVIPPPTVALPPGDFSFSAITDNFSAVNAYHHMDALYKMVEDFGFDLDTYFSGTVFPIPMDHRGRGGTVNASHQGPGTIRYRFGLVQVGCPVGIAASVRVVIHEFGHSLLSNNIGSGVFTWAHGVGDSLAAIMMDPGSIAPDRFMTFPWVSTANPGIDRRHDRAVGGAAGGAWGGTLDTGSYPSTTILSTTLFRAYQSLGGDSSYLNDKIFASRYMAYLIVRAVGSMTAVAPPTGPDDFATTFMDADTGTVNFEGHPGGALHKVIRWAFEKQGLYQPPAAPIPVITEGDPPEVDVYINDGRDGEYEYQANFWNTEDIWNRLSPDGGTDHQTPVLNVSNYLYVRVKNRGTETANNVVVKTYHCAPGTGLVWPDDWQVMDTPQLPAAPIASGGETIVGPFEWKPEFVGHECVMASVTATGDLSNADTVNGPILHSRLVPLDNNVAQRNLAPVPGGGGQKALLKAFKNRRFIVRNPFESTARIKIESFLPSFLTVKNWDVRFLSPGGTEFSVGPRNSRIVEFELIPGADFSAADVIAAGADRIIEFYTLADDMLVGGMSYIIDPHMDKPAREFPEGMKAKECSEIAKKLLECLNCPADEVKSVQIKRLCVDIELKGDC